MLGLYPIGARSISGSPASLVIISEQRSASLGLGFVLSGTLKAFVPVRANIGVSFPLSASAAVRLGVAAQLTLDFSLSGRLQLAGKPIIITALPSSYTTRASGASYTTKAVPASYTTRGVR